MKKGPNLRYSLLQGGYYLDYLIISSFAAVFLSSRGFTTAQIGMVTAGGSLLSCVLQQIAGTLADKTTKPLKWMVAGFILLDIFCFAMILVLPKMFLPTFVFYVAALTLQASTAPLLNSLCLQFSNNGYSMNFGLARSIGSLAYGLGAVFMGEITDMFGAEIILPIYLAVYAVVMGLLVTFPVPQKDESEAVVAGKELIKEEPSTMKEFFQKYHRFMVLMAGVMLVWFPQTMVNTYMLYFVQYHGGTSSDMGFALGLMAFVEIPFVMFGTNIMKKIGADTMLRIAAAGSILKMVLYLISPNLGVFIWSNVTNMITSGFYQVSIVYYCYSIVGEKDIVKGQTILGIAVSGISGMLANYLGGVLLEVVSIPTILIGGIITSIAAVVIVFYATDKNTFKNEKIRNI